MKVIYVYSGKGGVGKSTVCVNLAYAFSVNGYKTAIFDADLAGPSIPTMVNKIQEKAPVMDGVVIVPGVYGGVQINSLGFINKPIDGSFWIGRYLRGALYQLVLSAPWDADILLVDLPPGTGDIHKELFTKLPGKVIIVTTPQEVSYVDIVRSIDFIERLEIEILGIVENMSYYECKQCKTREKIFSGDTKNKLCELYDLELLAELPLNPEINQLSNNGIPYVYAKKNESESIEYLKLAKRITEIYDIDIGKRRKLSC